jgi:N-acetylglucosamine kinase-like BadF-type ATPase
MTANCNLEFFLAIDAGGTKTDFLLADRSADLARVRVGSIKTLNTPTKVAEVNFVAALQQLEQISGISARSLTRTCIGTSGFSVPSVNEWLRIQHGRHAAGELILCGDEEIALDAAFEGRRGVLALAGTGSNVMGRTGDGRRIGAGGWGPVLGDEGSGHWIGLEAVRAIFHSIDEGRATMLQEKVLSTWGLKSIQELLQLGNTAAPLKFAELTPIVVACAAKGDAVAAEVLRMGGKEMARMVGLVIRQMERMEKDAFVLPEIALAGSILQSIPAVREAMTTALRESWPEILVRAEPVDAVRGALWRARRAEI